MKNYMKISQSASYFLIILVSLAVLSIFLSDRSNRQDKILLQTLACQSDKIDDSILNLNAKTTLIGAFISFKKVPISQTEKEQLYQEGILLDEKSWIFDYVQAQIPTNSLCALVQEPNVSRVFIPDFR